MTKTNPFGQSLATFGRFLGIVVVSVALFVASVLVHGEDQPHMLSIAVPAAGLPLVSSLLGVALILLGVLRLMRLVAGAAADDLGPNLVPPATVILTGGILLHGGWPALGLAAVVAADVVTRRIGRQRDAAAADRAGGG